MGGKHERKSVLALSNHVGWLAFRFLLSEHTIAFPIDIRTCHCERSAEIQKNNAAKVNRNSYIAIPFVIAMSLRRSNPVIIIHNPYFYIMASLTTVHENKDGLPHFVRNDKSVNVKENCYNINVRVLLT